MKFILLVEGQTERDSAAAFLKRWLDSRLKMPVGIQTVKFEGYADLIRRMDTKVKMFLEGPKESEIIALIGLIDLYGPDFYPSNKTTAKERYDWAKAKFEKQINHSRFRMFFAVHEFEAWLLSQPSVFAREINDTLRRKVAEPEKVNFNEPPAKLLDRVYKQVTKRNYKKTTYGKQLFSKLDTAIAVDKCPYLKEMLGEMLDLAKTVGL